jgi:hypothetical protein
MVPEVHTSLARIIERKNHEIPTMVSGDGQVGCRYASGLDVDLVVVFKAVREVVAYLKKDRTTESP